MPVELATTDDLPAMRKLLRMARHSYCNVADEDLAAVVRRNLSFLSGQPGLPSGLLMADPELRPATLPEDAPTRIQVRALAIRNSGWYGTMLPELTAVTRTCARVVLAGHPAVIHSFASELWLGPALASVGFEQVETVVYFRKDRLQREEPLSPTQSPSKLRPAQAEDLPALALLDIASFDPFWHMGESDLGELLMRGRVTLAETGGEVAGYTALLNTTHEEAHLARIAVHPGMQGRGVGRMLLDDAIQWSRAQGCRSIGLNTQLSNHKSQALYRAAGFRESGLSLPVYALKVA